MIPLAPRPDPAKATYVEKMRKAGFISVSFLMPREMRDAVRQYAAAGEMSMRSAYVELLRVGLRMQTTSAIPDYVANDAEPPYPPDSAGWGV